MEKGKRGLALFFWNLYNERQLSLVKETNSQDVLNLTNDYDQ